MKIRSEACGVDRSKVRPFSAIDPKWEKCKMNIITHAALSRKILVVAVDRIEGAWCAYIGIVPGENHEKEKDSVARNGDKLGVGVARAIFPQLKNTPYAW